MSKLKDALAAAEAEVEDLKNKLQALGGAADEEDTADDESTESPADEATEDETAQEATPPADHTTSGPAVQDVDVATIGTDTLPGEVKPPLTGESSVVLGEHPDVPDWAVGKVAAVISAPVNVAVDGVTGAVTQSLPDNAIVTVRERSQGATFALPLEAFSKINPTGGLPASP